MSAMTMTMTMTLAAPAKASAVGQEEYFLPDQQIGEKGPIDPERVATLIGDSVSRAVRLLCRTNQDGLTLDRLPIRTRDWSILANWLTSERIRVLRRSYETDSRLPGIGQWGVWVSIPDPRGM
jgi:hypothetical protein